jgi:putative serine protease PepD
MSDSNDPFSAQPYIPPSSNRPDEGHEDAPADETPADDTVAEAPAEDTPSEPEPEQDVTQEPVSDDEPTVQVETPDETPAEQPVTQDASSTHEMPAVSDSRPDDDRESTVVLPVDSPPADSDQTDGTQPPRRGRRSLAGATALVVLAAGAGVGGAAVYDAVRGDNGTVFSSLDTGSESDTGDSAPAGQIEQVSRKVLPSVVQINVASSGEAGSGTGIIISSDGQIITNNHVVESAADGGSLTVSFNDGSNSKAEILGRDQVTDLAVIKVDGKNGLQPATLGSSADLAVGQQVVAIGSPYGLDGTVTSGIISKLNRPVASSDASGASQTVFPAIQTDAAINPGNSGGPLVDLQGRVIGINSAIRTNGSVESGSIGLGFAIPIDLAKNVSAQLVKGDKVAHARIGVTVGTAVSQDDITRIGAVVREVTKGSAGDDAGLKKGDIITKVNDIPIGSSNALVASIRGYQPGRTITLTYQRNGDEKTTKVKLESDGGKLGS